MWLEKYGKTRPRCIDYGIVTTASWYDVGWQSHTLVVHGLSSVAACCIFMWYSRNSSELRAKPKVLFISFMDK